MIGVAIIEASLLAALISVAVLFMRDFANEALIKRANTTAALFATTTKDAVLSYDLASLDTYTLDLLGNPDIVYVKVLSVDETELSSAGDQIFIDADFTADSMVESVHDGVFDVQKYIIEGETIYGEVQLGIAIGSITAAMNKVRNWTVGIAAIEMLLVAIFSYILGVYLTRNIYKLRHAAKELTGNIKEGQYESPGVIINSRDELEDLSVAFNELAETLESEHNRRTEYESELIRLNEVLEGKVELRAEQLEIRNTELEDINRDLVQTQEQLVHSEKMASVGQLAAGVAHEINNPLGYVTSNLKVLSNYNQSYQAASEKMLQFVRSDSPEERKRLVHELIKYYQDVDFSFINQDSTEILQDSVGGLERIAEIVKNLKQFSHSDDEKMQECDVNACIKTALNMVKNEVKYHCEVKTDLQPVPIIQANIGRIIQVVTNLLINSSQAIEKDGILEVSTQSSDKEVVIQVTDNGVGIPAQIAGKIFDPFFTTKPIGKGTGLGLSISYDIVQEHNGSIEVQSEENNGTTFIVRLPLRPIEEEENRLDSRE